MNFQPPSPRRGNYVYNSPFGGWGAWWRITESNRWPSRPKAGRSSTFLLKLFFVENNGVEPLASCVQGRRSSQLS